jgi:hypothetical protein
VLLNLLAGAFAHFDEALTVNKQLAQGGFPIIV